MVRITHWNFNLNITTDKAEVIEVGEVKWRGEMEYMIQFVMDQMLYPEARYFTPNGTCKNSICWNGPWNMSALAEGSLAVHELAVWLRRSRAASGTPWAVRGERAMLLWQSDSRDVAAAACTDSLRAQEREEEEAERGETRDPIIRKSPCCWMSVWWRDCKLPLPLNVTKGAICIHRQHLLPWIKMIMVSRLVDRCVTSLSVLWR